MHILMKTLFFIIFLGMAVAAMFLGGISGVAGTFYLMVEPGNVPTNLTMLIAVLVPLWLLVLVLRRHNKKVLKKNALQQTAEKEAE